MENVFKSLRGPVVRDVSETAVHRTPTWTAVTSLNHLSCSNNQETNSETERFVHKHIVQTCFVNPEKNQHLNFFAAII